MYKGSISLSYKMNGTSVQALVLVGTDGNKESLLNVKMEAKNILLQRMVNAW